MGDQSPADVTTSRATTDDVDALVDLWVSLAADQRTHGSHLCAEGNRDQIRQSLARQVVVDGVLVARVDDVVGFVMYGLETGSYEQDVTRGVVHNIFVTEPYRGRGVGARLLTEAERDMAEAGVDVVALEVLAENDAAREFYRDNGYGLHRLEFEKVVTESSTATSGDGDASESDTHSKEDR